MDDASLRLRLAAQAIFEACFPGDDFEKSEAESFPRHRSVVVAAERVLELRAADLPPRRHLTPAAVAFEIRFALGQAPASFYVDARSKDRDKRERALEQLVERVAARFAAVEMSYPLKPGWNRSPFQDVQKGPPQRRGSGSV